MRGFLYLIPATSILSVSLLGTSCSLQNPTKTPLHIEIPHSSELSRSALHSRTQSTASNYTTPPSSLSDFDCFAVNVTAPEIAPQTPQPCTLPSDMIGAAGGWVSTNTSANSSSVSIDLMVPTGPERLIQIYGVRTPDQCPKLGDFKSARLGDIYLIGSVTQDILDDTDVSIKAHLDTSKKTLTSCQSGSISTGNGSSINLGTTTYYVLGPTGTSITLPLPNSGQYTLSSVGTPTNIITTAADAGDHINFSYNPNYTRGVDHFTYTAVDSSGQTGTGNIVIKNVTSTTWTGEYGDHNWSSAGNWCGSVNISHTACTNTGPVPATGSLAYFDGTCTPANCSANIPNSTTVYMVQLAPDYPGTITESAGATLTITHLLQIQGGTVNINNATASLNTTQLEIDGGSLISSASSMSLGTSYGVNIQSGLLDLSSTGSVSMGDLTINNGTLHAPESGTITYNGGITTYAGATINSGATITAHAVLNNSTPSTLSLHLNSPINFQNLQIQSGSSNGHYQLNNNLNVQGTLKLDGMYGGSAPSLTSGSINVQGDLIVDTNFSGYSGSTTVVLNGSNHQTITLPGTVSLPPINVNKSGMLVINNPSPLTLQSLAASQVEHIGSGPLYLPAGTINVGTFTQGGNGVVNFSASTLNGNLYIKGGYYCNLNGALNITGSLTMELLSGFYRNSYGLSWGSIVNDGTIY